MATPTPEQDDELRQKLVKLKVFTAALEGSKRAGITDTDRFTENWLRELETLVNAYAERKVVEARIDELNKAMSDYGYEEGISYNSTPVVTYRNIIKRIEELATLSPKPEEEI